MSLSVFVFLMLFGSLIMTEPVMQAWLGHNATTCPAPGVSRELLQVATFLSAFSGSTDRVDRDRRDYREQFFGSVLRELERAVGVRAVYLAVRERDLAAR